MADLQDVALFCLLYSGVVFSALWMAISRKAEEPEREGERFPHKKVI